MITVLGSINMDLVATPARLPRPGETVSGDSFMTVAGGKGANQALAARRAGSMVRMAGAVGTDAFAEPAVALLRQAGADLTLVKTVPGSTGTALILVGGDGENMITVIAAANGALTAADTERALDGMQAGDILMLQFEVPAAIVEQALNLARQRGIRTILNLAPLVADARRLADLADIVIANETEFELLAGEVLDSTGAREAMLRQLHAKSGQTIVVTLGGEGAMAMQEGQFFRAHGLAITPVDTVGAGDTFCGYLAAALDRGADLGAALRHAAVAGSLACLNRGAQAAIPLQAEVDMAMLAAAEALS
ncbi:ribokinase [Rhizobium sp. CG5]|uniref:ribokinase n=1 Tax=Rhizobium sp. CG5 TaxID=2726076 RepID=UPI002033AFF8|nr:ribokinase [Rhizobium sp. CG5]MCM2474588.1 ribokinase [Rhizobium sp. CG5]